MRRLEESFARTCPSGAGFPIGFVLVALPFASRMSRIEKFAESKKPGTGAISALVRYKETSASIEYIAITLDQWVRNNSVTAFRIIDVVISDDLNVIFFDLRESICPPIRILLSRKAVRTFLQS